MCQGERSVQLHDGCLFEKGVARPSPELVGVRLCFGDVISAAVENREA